MIRLFIWSNIACVGVFMFGIADGDSHEILKMMANHGQWIAQTASELISDIRKN